MKNLFFIILSVISLSASADTRPKYTASEALREAMNVKVQLVGQKVVSKYDEDKEFELKTKTLTYKVSVKVTASDLESLGVKGFRTNDHVEHIYTNAEELATALNSYSFPVEHSLEQATMVKTAFCNPFDGSHCAFVKFFKLNHYEADTINSWFDLILEDETFSMVNYSIEIPRSRVK